jgi:hypothetical protein
LVPITQRAGIGKVQLESVARLSIVVKGYEREQRSALREIERQIH